MENNDYDSLNNDSISLEKEEVYSESFRAGKRTYFFDVKKTKTSELYITITESKRKIQKNGKFTFEKHHIYLYKEDFDKFVETIGSTVNYVKENQPLLTTTLPEKEPHLSDSLTPIFNFEDLDE